MDRKMVDRRTVLKSLSAGAAMHPFISTVNARDDKLKSKAVLKGSLDSPIHKEEIVELQEEIWNNMSNSDLADNYAASIVDENAPGALVSYAQYINEEGVPQYYFGLVGSKRVSVENNGRQNGRLMQRSVADRHDSAEEFVNSEVGVQSDTGINPSEEWERLDRSTTEAGRCPMGTFTLNVDFWKQKNVDHPVFGTTSKQLNYPGSSNECGDSDWYNHKMDVIHNWDHGDWHPEYHITDWGPEESEDDGRSISIGYGGATLTWDYSHPDVELHLNHTSDTPKWEYDWNIGGLGFDIWRDSDDPGTTTVGSIADFEEGINSKEPITRTKSKMTFAKYSHMGSVRKVDEWTTSTKLTHRLFDDRIE